MTDSERFELDGVKAQKDRAYSERNQCVALLARMAMKLGYRAWLGKHDPADTIWESDWRNIVFIELPTGQVSWHLHDSEMPLFADVPDAAHTPWAGMPEWDGHTTELKHERVKWCRP